MLRDMTAEGNGDAPDCLREGGVRDSMLAPAALEGVQGHVLTSASRPFSVLPPDEDWRL